MDCGTDDYASGVLERYGYYRLSGYWHPFRAWPQPPWVRVDADGRDIRLDGFVGGTRLAHVVALYELDGKLRTGLNEVLSSIEIALRFLIGHRLGKIDKFAHRKPELLGALQGQSSVPTKGYLEWVEEYDRHENRAREGFVLHFRRKYGRHLPVWVATEVMSLGVLSNLYSFLPQIDQDVLAARLQILAVDGRADRGTLANWLNNLRNVRNICAHHGRLWNRTFDVILAAPGSSRVEPASHLHALAVGGANNRIYGVLMVARYLLATISPSNTDVINLAHFLDSKSTELGFDLADLGFPQGWRTQEIWRRGFRLDRAPNSAASLLDRADFLSAPKTRELLSASVTHPVKNDRFEVATAKAQRELLRWYIKKRVVIEVELGGVKYYPQFQFRDGKIIDAVADINQQIAERCADFHPVQLAGAQLDWWQKALAVLSPTSSGNGRSPLELLNEVPEEEFRAEIAQSGAARQLVVPLRGRQWRVG